MTATIPAPLVDTHPLTTTVERIVALGGGRLKARVGPAGGDGWFAATDAIEDAEPLLAPALIRLGESLGTSDARVISSFFFKSYCNVLTGAGLASYLAERRVPALDAGNVALHADASGRIDEIALLGGTLAVLPDDPAAGHPDVVVLPDLAALREHLLTQLLDDHLAHAIDAMRPVLALGRRTLRGLAADTIAGIVILTCKRLGQPERCAAEVQAFTRHPLLAGRSGDVCIEDDAARDYFLTRAACCFAYRLPQYPHCPTCPLLTPEQRECRLRESMREHAS